MLPQCSLFRIEDEVTASAGRRWRQNAAGTGLGDRHRGGATAAAAHAAIRGSVLMTGLLPRPDWAGAAGGFVDASGLGSLAGQRTPIAVPTLIDPGKDTARIKLDRLTLRPVAQRHPSVHRAHRQGRAVQQRSSRRTWLSAEPGHD